MSSKNLTSVKDLDFAKRFAEAFGTDKPAEIERKYGLSYHTAKNYLEGRLPTAEILKEIKSLTNVQIDWLLTGKGQKYADHPDDLKLEPDHSNDAKSDADHPDDYKDEYDFSEKDYEEIERAAKTVTPAQKFLINGFEDVVIEIIHDVIREVVRNEVALALGEKLSREQNKNNLDVIPVAPRTSDKTKILKDKPQESEKKRA